MMLMTDLEFFNPIPFPPLMLMHYKISVNSGHSETSVTLITLYLDLVH